MKIHKIEWFDEFECIGGACPQTCCKGWLIPLDEEDLLRYRKERGGLAISLFTATAGYTRNRINLCSGECRFHTKEGLCRLQLKKGHDFIPWACRSFPRFYRNYGEFEERYLDLSCIAAAGIFVRNMGNIRITEDAAEPETKPCTTNDDTAYLDTLLSIRKDIIDAISSDKIRNMTGDTTAGTVHYAETMEHIYSYACRLQDLYAAEGEATVIPSLCEYEALRNETLKNGAVSASPLKAVDASSGVSSIFPFPLNVISRLTETILYYFGQKKTGPALYGLLSDARDVISDYRRTDTDLIGRMNGILNSGPLLSGLPGAYLSYYLYQYFLDAYETYSFRRITALGIIHVNMILFLILVLTEKRKIPVNTGRNTPEDGPSDGLNTPDISPDDIASVTALYNRKVYFNETIQNNLYEIFEEMT